MQQYLSRNVGIQRTVYLGRPALKVAYTDEYQNSVGQSDSARSVGFVEIPLTTFFEGSIQIDVASERNGKTRLADGGVGLAFRIQSSDRYELVYLRTASGKLDFLPPSTVGHAIQYASPREWTHDVLRNRFPGRYEAAAKIGQKRWHRLHLSVRNNSVAVYIDNNPRPALQVNLLGVHNRGSVAYWVNSGTNAYFSNLKIVEY